MINRWNVYELQEVLANITMYTVHSWRRAGFLLVFFFVPDWFVGCTPKDIGSHFSLLL